ncbi:MAG: diguanylate cyclase [Candidatus Aminicenantes bacterium]|nr:diguanylate cyclase [Candidatus Aminicenantes bacterium]
MGKTPTAAARGADLLRELFWNSSLPIAVLDGDGRLVLASKSFRDSFPGLIVPGDRERLRLEECAGGAIFTRAASRPPGERFTLSLRVPFAGSETEVTVQVAALGSRHQGRPLFLSEWFPAGGRASLARSLEEVEQKYRTLQENLPVGIYRADEEGNILTANGALLRMMGFSSFEELQEARLEDVWIDPGQRAALIERLRQHGAVLNHEVHLRRRGGEELIAAFDARGFFDAAGRLLYFDTIVQDITRRVRATRELERLARTDGLTGLFNRQHFLERLEAEAERAGRYRRPLSLMLIDLDRFKGVNDEYGHLAGDEVLVSAASRIRGVLRKSDFAGRYGGEEFCVALPETGVEGAAELAERLRKAMASRAHSLPGGGSLRVSCSIGVATAGAAGVADLLARADAALYAAKSAGRDRVHVAAED